ncbi:MULTISPECIES: hypothetical protein [unclassified Mesorhizobium]|uniref:hypothetical protein n=1 Tax=unclassified Mesorhizobium TaxID=325217 RepID=UPI000AAAC2BB|nr:MULTISPECIES: hypothetical protein [unclassified Mesorhizobium]
MDRISCRRRPEHLEHSLFPALASLYRQWMLGEARTPSAIPSDCIRSGAIFWGKQVPLAHRLAVVACGDVASVER